MTPWGLWWLAAALAELEDVLWTGLILVGVGLTLRAVVARLGPAERRSPEVRVARACYAVAVGLTVVLALWRIGTLLTTGGGR